MQPAAPDPAARLQTIVEAVAQRAEEARERLDRLASEIGLEPAPPHASPEPADPARLAAIELAVSGADRAETETHLRRRFPAADHTAILDDVFGA